MSTRQQQEDEAYEIDQACPHLDNESPVLHVCLACYRTAQAAAEARRDALWREALVGWECPSCGVSVSAEQYVRCEECRGLRALLGAAEPKAPPSLAVLVEQQEGQQGAAAPAERLRGDVERLRRELVGMRRFGDSLHRMRAAIAELDALPCPDTLGGHHCEVLGPHVRHRAEHAAEGGGDLVWPPDQIRYATAAEAGVASGKPTAGPPAAAALATSREGLDLTGLRAQLERCALEGTSDCGHESFQDCLRAAAAALSLDRAAQEQQGSKNES